MLGSMILYTLNQYREYEIHAFVRKNNFNFKKNSNIKIHEIDFQSDIVSSDLERLFLKLKPSHVINCIGLVKQKLGNNADHIKVNSLLPHFLFNFCKLHGSKFIHFSTDCVFNGSKGNYIENDIPDANDIYGRSKLLGEIYDENAITLRTSIIGPQIFGNHSLLEWFLSQRNPIHGFKNAIFSGLTTYEVSKLIHKIIEQNIKLDGLFHLSMEAISKYELLNIFRDIFNHNIDIYKDTNFVIDRSLNSSKFRSQLGYTPPSWHESINDLYNNTIKYKEFYNV